MKGIEKIAARLEADLQLELDALDAETQKECDAIAAEFAEKAEAAYAEAREAGEKECALRAERSRNAADMEARTAVLALKQEMVTAAFDRAAEKLAGMPKERYVAFLAALAAKAASTGEEEILFSAADKAECGKAVASAANALLKQRGIRGSLTVSEQTRDIPGGLILRSGDIETNCATDTLLATNRGALSAQVAELLFR